MVKFLIYLPLIEKVNSIQFSFGPCNELLVEAYQVVFLGILCIVGLELCLLFVILFAQLLQHHPMKLKKLVLNMISTCLQLHHLLQSLLLQLLLSLLNLIIKLNISLKISRRLSHQLLHLDNIMIIMLIPLLNQALGAEVFVTRFAEEVEGVPGVVRASVVVVGTDWVASVGQLIDLGLPSLIKIDPARLKLLQIKKFVIAYNKVALNQIGVVHPIASAVLAWPRHLRHLAIVSI